MRAEDFTLRASFGLWGAGASAGRAPIWDKPLLWDETPLQD